MRSIRCAVLLSPSAAVLPRIRPPAGRCSLPGKWEVCAGTDSVSALSLGGGLLRPSLSDRSTCLGPVGLLSFPELVGRCTCPSQEASGASLRKDWSEPEDFGRQLESVAFFFFL